jgi:uncharacterized membrane protein
MWRVPLRESARVRSMRIRVPLSLLWRRETLRTNLWLVPAIEVLVAVLLFGITHELDNAAYDHRIGLPSWVIGGSADAARQVLAALAGAEITVVGVVFSITIVALTLASTQFGPRMLRNFIRDRGTQVTLGTFVATMVYTVLVLASIGAGPHGDFVPHLSITICMGFVLLDLAVLIYFISHTAIAIQLPHVIANIADDLSGAIDADARDALRLSGGSEPDREGDQTMAAFPDEPGGVVLAPAAGYLQLVRYDTLVRIAAQEDALIELRYRPGHFLVKGQPMATVWPAAARARVTRQLERAHVTGAMRTLTQDVTFAVDQLVEIALRALSPAVNDTFTAVTCIDWLGDGLCQAATRWQPARVHCDQSGRVRLISAPVSYDRLIERAFEKIRQAGRGMPAIMIRQLDALAAILEQTRTEQQRRVLVIQARMILQSSIESVPEPSDRDDVRRRYDRVLAAYHRSGDAPGPEAGGDGWS